MDKKYLWRMLTVMLVAMLSFSFVSCGDDDDENGGGNTGLTVTTENLAGLWELYHVKGHSVNVDDKRITFDRDVTTSAEDLAWLESADFLDFVRYEFGKDNSFKCYSYEYGDFGLEAETTFTIKGQTIIVGPDKDEDYFNVTALTDSELVIHGSDPEDGYDVYASFKRIK